MNEKENQKNTKSEYIATKIMRGLAIVGLISVLLLTLWAVVQGVRLVPNAGKNITATLTSVKNLFNSPDSEKPLSIEKIDGAVNSGKAFALNWDYAGEEAPKDYVISYLCTDGVELSVLTDTGWKDVDCNEGVVVDGSGVSLIVTNNDARNSKTEIFVKTKDGAFEDSSAISILNVDVFDESDSSKEITKNDFTSPSSETKKKEVGNNNLVKKTNQHISVKSKKSDLVLNIEETGILLGVNEKNVFFPVSPIPNDKFGAVKFTVANSGDFSSGSWFFKAWLPTDGDGRYEYVSDVQSPVAPGTYEEYTLGFDKIADDKKGKITIEIFPLKTSDNKTNNKESVSVEIK